MRKGPGMIEVCDKHRGDVAEYRLSADETRVESARCVPVPKIIYIRSTCQYHEELKGNKYETQAPENNRLEQIIGGSISTVDSALDGHTWYVPSLKWRDAQYRMPDYNATPRRYPLDQEDEVSPTSEARPYQPTGILNPRDTPEKWRDADGRPIDMLANHYNEMNDPASRTASRNLGPVYSASQKAQGAPQQNDTNQAPQPNNDQGQTHANQAPGASATNGAGAAGGPPPPPPPPPPNPFDRFGGAFRQQRGSSSDSSSSSGSSSSPSPPLGPANANAAPIANQPRPPAAAGHFIPPFNLPLFLQNTPNGLPPPPPYGADDVDGAYDWLMGQVEHDVGLQPDNFGNRRIIIRGALDGVQHLNLTPAAMEGVRNRLKDDQHLLAYEEEVAAETVERQHSVDSQAALTQHVRRILERQESDGTRRYLVEWEVRRHRDYPPWTWLPEGSVFLTRRTLAEWENAIQNNQRARPRAVSIVERIMGEYYEERAAERERQRQEALDLVREFCPDARNVIARSSIEGMTIYLLAVTTEGNKYYDWVTMAGEHGQYTDDTWRTLLDIAIIYDAEAVDEVMNMLRGSTPPSDGNGATSPEPRREPTPANNLRPSQGVRDVLVAELRGLIETYVPRPVDDNDLYHLLEFLAWNVQGALDLLLRTYPPKDTVEQSPAPTLTTLGRTPTPPSWWTPPPPAPRRRRPRQARPPPAASTHHMQTRSRGAISQSTHHMNLRPRRAAPVPAAPTNNATTTRRGNARSTNGVQKGSRATTRRRR